MKTTPIRKDPDPQFQPKIDAWAPLFYAHAKGLPPACFCTGGRDLEWRGRVEENELLARALRDCGYPRTEFHETEGDHGGGVLESAYHLRDFVMKMVEADGVARLADGERVVFFGDSITHDGRYVYNLQLGLGITVDGLFGSGTESKVRDFQRANGLTADGYAGDATKSELWKQAETTIKAGGK